MASPGGEIPPGSLEIGDFESWRARSEAQAKDAMKSGVVGSYTNVQEEHRTEVRDRIDLTYSVALEAQGHADQAVTEAEAAANAAVAAEATAAAAYNAASYWESEFVAASAAVVRGVNELLIGLCQNVPTGLVRKATDIHVAFLSQPNGLTFELKKWNPAGTSDSVVDTFVLTANQTRANWTLDHEAFNRERFYINVTSVTGSVAPVVLQILLFGVLYDPAIQIPD